ncbi:MAG: phage tail length tape measure family protein [Brevundimonas sp.]
MRQEAVTVLRLDASQHNAAAAEASAAVGRIGGAAQNTAKQTAQAMRSLPAQFTDVATSLAGGQNPLLVLLQQGGQVRDQFGSIGAAARGIGTLLTPAVVGVGAFAAVTGTLALAYSQAAAEQDAFTRGLVLSGNSAGVTRDVLNEMAQAQGELAGTQRQAAQALGALAGSGNVAAAQLAQVTAAAIALERAGGPAVEETIKKFVALGKAPLQTLISLNEAENFLTRSIYEQVKALQERGMLAEAAAVAQEAYAKAGASRAAELETQLGGIQRAWRSVTDVAAKAWDTMLGIGRPETLEDQLATALKQQQEAGLPRRGGNNLQSEERRAAIQRRVDELRMQIYQQGESAAVQQSSAESTRQYIRDQAQRDAAARESAAAAKTEAARQAAIRRETAINTGVQTFDEMFPAANVREITGSRDINRQARADELGSYDATARAESEAEARRLERKRQTDQQLLDQQTAFLQELGDANARANIDLIADDQQRAYAQIALEREQLQRRIEAIYASGPERAAAERAADAASAAKMQAAGTRLARDTALVTREETRDALAAAFQDSKNPIKAFGDALGNIVFQRVSTALADALLNAALGSSGSGGGLFGGLLGGLGSLFGAPAGLGGIVEGLAGGLDLDAAFDLGPIPKLATGTNYVPRDMLAMIHEGEAVLPKRYNPAAGGQAPNSSSVVVEINQTLNIGQGVGRAEVATAMVQAKEAAKGEIMQLLERERVLR